MGLLNLVRVEVGEVGVQPGLVKMLTTDNLSKITTAGYLNGIGNQLPVVNLSPLDVVECMYSYDTILGNAKYAELTVSVSNGVITLNAWSGVAKQYTTVGGAAAEAITVTGAQATDLAFVQMVNNGTNNVTIVDAVVTANTLTVTFSGDPAADTVINYQLVKSTG